MKSIIYLLSVFLLLVSCGETKKSENQIIDDPIQSENQIIDEPIEPNNSIIGNWKSKSFNGDEWEGLYYKIVEDSTLVGVDGSKGVWSITDDQFCEKLQVKQTCFRFLVEGDKLTLTNELGWVFVYERTEEDIDLKPELKSKTEIEEAAAE